jgi:hypothetical protein
VRTAKLQLHVELEVAVNFSGFGLAPGFRDFI